jgi:diguanylate cyclase (GGDEF)-like protein
METVLRVLLLEDVPTDAELETVALRRANIPCESRRVETEHEFLDQLEKFKPDLVLSDFTLPHFDGLKALKLMRERQPELPFIFVSGTIGEERAVEALRNGATDYILKSNLLRLPAAVTRAVREAGDRRRQARQEERLGRLARIRALQSGLGSALVRMRDPQELYRVACAVAVEQGGFALAWVGQPVSGMANIEPIAWSGRDEGYLDEIAHRPGDVSEDWEGHCAVLRQGSAIAVADIESDAKFGLRREALARGYRSMIALPLVIENKVTAVFKIYAAEPGFFGAEETRLLSDLAADISYALDYRSKEEELSRRAYHDGLTGLANRHLLQEHLKQELARAHRMKQMVAVVFIDLDHFKSVNDTVGHGGGDRLLKKVSERIVSCTREGDIVARLGGDEFIMVMPVKTKEAAAPVVKRVLDTVSRAVRIGSRKLNVTCSIGVAMYPQDGRQPETLLRNADAAMYRAKKLGRRNFQFYAAVGTETHIAPRRAILKVAS